MTLPHDWGIDGAFVENLPGGTGKLPFAGVGWYRKHFSLPADDSGKRIFLDMDGAMSYANVWLNGSYVGGWPYGYSSFRLDPTPYVKTGGDNVIAIRLDNPANSSRWYPGGGIYRNVWLVKTSPVHVGQWGTYLTTPEVSADSATVELKVTVANDGKADARISVSTEFYPIDASDHQTGPSAASAKAELLPVPAGGKATSAITTRMANPKLWSTRAPQRYVAVTTVEQDGKVIDTYETPFGIRTVKFDPIKGMIVNGEPVKIQGVCDHADLGPLGAAINTRALQRQIEILQGMGCNAIRT